MSYEDKTAGTIKYQTHLNINCSEKTNQSGIDGRTTVKKPLLDKGEVENSLGQDWWKFVL